MKEKSFTKQLAQFLNNWAEGATEFGQTIGGKDSIQSLYRNTMAHLRSA